MNENKHLTSIRIRHDIWSRLQRLAEHNNNAVGRVIDLAIDFYLHNSQAVYLAEEEIEEREAKKCAS